MQLWVGAHPIRARIVCSKHHVDGFEGLPCSGLSSTRLRVQRTARHDSVHARPRRSLCILRRLVRSRKRRLLASAASLAAADNYIKIFMVVIPTLDAGSNLMQRGTMHASSVPSAVLALRSAGPECTPRQHRRGRQSQVTARMFCNTRPAACTLSLRPLLLPLRLECRGQCAIRRAPHCCRRQCCWPTVLFVHLTFLDC